MTTPTLDEKRAELNRIVALSLKGESTKEDDDLYITYSADIRDAKNAKTAKITELKALIKDNEIVIAELFNDAEFKAAGYSKSPKVADEGATEKYPYASNGNEVLLKFVPKKIGEKPFELKQGRIYEPLNGKGTKPFGQSVPVPLKNYGVSQEKLMEITTPYGKTYFETTEGQAELAVILEVAKVKVKAEA